MQQKSSRIRHALLLLVPIGAVILLTMPLILLINYIRSPQNVPVTPQATKPPNSTPSATPPTLIGCTSSAELRKANPYPSYLSEYGTLALYDPLRSNDAGCGWDVYKPNQMGESCQFKGNTYDALQLKAGILTYCFPLPTRYRNFAVEVQM